MKHLSKEEFVQYISDLDFQEFEDLLGYMRAYYDEYTKTAKLEDEEEAKMAWFRYSCLLSKYGHVLLKFAEEIVEKQKIIEQKMEEIEDVYARAN